MLRTCLRWVRNGFFCLCDHWRPFGVSRYRMMHMMDADMTVCFCLILKRLQCLLFGHRWQRFRGYSGGFVSLIACARCGKWDDPRG